MTSSETKPSAWFVASHTSRSTSQASCTSLIVVTSPASAASAPKSNEVAASAAVDGVLADTQAAASASGASSTPQAAIAASAASAPTLPAFEWPLATRVTYLLTGYFRGDLAGTAQVEWVREGPRYQVHLDVTVGLHIAPFMSRRMSSEGLITEAGLRPERYDQETRLPFSTPTRAVVRLQDEHVELANGQRRERWADVQDTASQFVHLAWRFSTQPSLLRPGAVITVPLAMPRSMQRMQYDVSEPEMLWTEFGEVPVIRLKPRHVPRPGGDLSVEMWLAPGYRYLPIRLKIHQDPETWVDLRITKPPELGGP